MKVTLLGTGTSGGVPMIGCSCKVCQSVDPRDKRLRTSALIETSNGKKIVIDCGPDFRQQLLREKVYDIDAILFTHEHKDHTGGLDDVRAINFATRRSIPLYGTSQVLNALKRQYDYVFTPNPYPGLPQIDLVEIDDQPFDLLGTRIIPINVMHADLPVLGFRIEDFTYVTDASYISDAEKEKIKGSKALTINALRKSKHYSHFNLDEAISLAGELKPDFTYLIHVSHQLGLFEEVMQELPEGIELGYDGLSIYL